MYDLNEISARLVAMEKDALVGMDAVPYWPYQQESAPYFWNRMADMQVDREFLSPDIAIDRYVWHLGLVIGHLTAGYSGENVTNVQDWIAALLAYFDTHKDLTTTANAAPVAYPAPPDFLWIEDGGALITAIPGGLRTLANDGIGVTQHTIVFTLDVPLLRQRY